EPEPGAAGGGGKFFWAIRASATALPTRTSASPHESPSRRISPNSCAIWRAETKRAAGSWDSARWIAARNAGGASGRRSAGGGSVGAALGERGNVAAPDHLDDLDVGLGVEQALAGHRLPQRGRDGEQVADRRGGLADEDLGRHVRQGTLDEAGRGVLGDAIAG